MSGGRGARRQTSSLAACLGTPASFNCCLLSLGGTLTALSRCARSASCAFILLCSFSVPHPLSRSGLYYWQRSQRTEQVQVKMVTADDERSADVIIQGSDEEVERLRRELKLMEKGMVYVKGIFEM